ncbi:MAG: ABC transporter permease, partial [Candidatus Dormibacteraceae bacterium]
MSSTAQKSLSLVERNFLGYRRAWWLFLSGLLEPFFYLAGIGFGVGSLIGSVGGHSVPYPVFVAPGLMAVAAMNGALYDCTFSLLFKIKYVRIYDAILNTPISPREIILGEVVWALIRGAVYSAAFLVAMEILRLTPSPWAWLNLLAVVLIGFTFAAGGSAVTTFLDSWQEFGAIGLVMSILFLFSGTIFPISIYPPPLRLIVELSPLTRGVDLLRSLN